MSYYGLILNRTFQVIVTDRHVCGGRVRGLLSAPASVGPQHSDPQFYVHPALAGRYDGVDPESDAFLAIDRANFRVPRETILRVERITRRKWGLGGLPSSGRIVLHLDGGHRRELILLGQQDAEAIERGLARRS